MGPRRKCAWVLWGGSREAARDPEGARPLRGPRLRAHRLALREGAQGERKETKRRVAFTRRQAGSHVRGGTSACTGLEGMSVHCNGVVRGSRRLGGLGPLGAVRPGVSQGRGSACASGACSAARSELALAPPRRTLAPPSRPVQGPCGVLPAGREPGRLPEGGRRDALRGPGALALRPAGRRQGRAPEEFNHCCAKPFPGPGSVRRGMPAFPEARSDTAIQSGPSLVLHGGALPLRSAPVYRTGSARKCKFTQRLSHSSSDSSSETARVLE